MGCKIVLGDRPVHITIARLWAALSILEKTRFIWQMLITGLLPDPKEISETVESLKVRLIHAMVKRSALVNLSKTFK